MQVNEKIFEVDQIVCRREKRGKEEYLVRWKGFDVSSATWEPVENLLSCTDLIEQFARLTRPIPGANPHSLINTEKKKTIHLKMLLNRKRKNKQRCKSLSIQEKIMLNNDENKEQTIMEKQTTTPSYHKKKLTEGEKLIRDTLVHESKTMVPHKTNLNKINDILNCYDSHQTLKLNGSLNGHKRSLSRTNRLRDAKQDDLVQTKIKKNYMEITLNNTTRCNVLTIAMLDMLSDNLLKARKNPDIKAVLLSNNGDYFCSGIDYSDLMNCYDDKEYKDLVFELVAGIRHFLNILFSFTKPIVCAINGPAIEFGMALVIASDLAYSTSKACFEVLYNKLNLSPVGCITELLPQVVGSRMANSMLYIGGRYSAVSASDRGLVLEMFGINSFEEDMEKKMNQLTANSTQVLESTKKLVKHFDDSRLAEICNEELNSYQTRLLGKEFKQKLKEDWTMLVNLYGDI